MMDIREISTINAAIYRKIIGKKRYNVAMKALATNKLASSPQYQRIIHEYNERFEQTGGRVNDAKFYREVILRALPSYHIQSWYQFIRRFKGSTGLIEISGLENGPRSVAKAEDGRLQNNLLTNEAVTRLVIQMMLNISAARLEEVWNNPSLLSAKEAIMLGLKAMKAQDSRIHAVAKMTEDRRAQTVYDRAVSEACWG